MLALILFQSAHLCLAAPVCQNATNPVFVCPANASCFCSPSCNSSLPSCVSVSKNITFSTKYHLKLDLYQPALIGNCTLRPAIVAIHGGGFSGGTRGSEQTWCERLAARGYVCATVDYRLHKGINPGKDPLQYPEIILNSTEDVRAAIRWLRAQHLKYRIDVTRIGALGASAGAMVVAYLVAVPGEGDGGNPGSNSSIQAGVSFSGALLETEYNEIKADQPPFFDLHGCNDAVVPYSAQSRPPLSFLFNAVSTHDAMVKAGARAWLMSFPNAAHVGTWAMREAINRHAQNIYAFFAEHLNLSSAQCCPPTG